MSARVVQFPSGTGNTVLRENSEHRARRIHLHRILDKILDDCNHPHPLVRSNVRYAMEVLSGGGGVYECNLSLKAEGGAR